MRRLFPALCVLCCAATGAFSQTDTGAITGVISDSSDAVMPGASITVRNPATGLTYNAESNGAGIYLVSGLPIGNYEMSVRQNGFETVERHGITIDAGTRARIDVRMQVGAMSQITKVTSELPLLQTETSSLSQVVENATIVNMPLNGRNYQQLALLAPGVMPQRTTNAVTDGFSVNGAQMTQNEFIMDGMDNTNYHYGVVIASNQVMKPSVDAIQEFTVMTHNFSAEFGRAGGGVVVVTTKSGTNQFHGTTFEFLRNDKLDANNFFNNLGGKRKPAYRQNQFGGTFGGPVKKDKTFFFASYQGTRIRQSLTSLTTVPTPAMLNGNFGSTVLYDPGTQDASGTRQPFPGNTIPSSAVDPVSLRLLQLYPAPNLTGTQNYLANLLQPARDDQVDSRLDHRFREADSVFLRYSYHNFQRTEPGTLPPPANGSTAVRSALGDTAVLSYTHLFPGYNIVNEIRVAYSRNDGLITVPTTTKLWQQYGFQGLFDRSDMVGLPNYYLSGYAFLGDRNWAPDPKVVDLKQIVENLSWQKGRHSIRFGTNIRNFRRYMGTTDYARGLFNFNGQFTSKVAGVGGGNAFADALLGLTSTATVSNAYNTTLFATAMEYYAQDDFKLSRKLTLNLGVRWEYMPPYVEWHNRYSNFVFQKGLPGYGTVLLAPTSGSSEERSFQQASTHDFAPRLGLAYQITGSTVLRLGYGIFYDTSSQTPVSNLPATNPPYYLRSVFQTASSGATSSIVIRNGFPGAALQPEATAVGGRSLFTAWPYAFPDAATNMWNMNLQQGLPNNVSVSVSYVGSNTVHRRAGNETLAGQDLNQPAPGPGALGPRRAFPAISTILTDAPVGGANYQALEVSVERRFKGGFSLVGGYTWSHALMVNVGENTRILQREKSLSPQDIRNRVFNTVVWALPFGPKQRWVTSGLASHLLRNWQLSTLLTAQSGLIFTPAMSANPSNTTGATRPDRVASGVLNGAERSWRMWFNKAAFQVPALYTFGNAGAQILRGPGVFNIDASVYRGFQIKERAHLEFRSEFFNLDNHVNLSNPNALIDNAVGGMISSTSTAARQIQFGMKLVF